MHSNDTILNKADLVSDNYARNEYAVSSSIPKGSVDHAYLEAFLSLDALLEQDEVKELYSHAMALNEEGGEALSEETKYIECAKLHVKEADQKLREFDELAIPLKTELEEGVKMGRKELPDDIKIKFHEMRQLERTVDAHMFSSRHADRLAKEANKRACDAFDKRDNLLGKMPELLDAITTLQLLSDQASDELVAIVEQHIHH